MNYMFGLLATPALVIPVAAHAEEAAETVADARIVVTATRASVGIPANQLGGSVTLLDSQAIAARQTRTVSDILRDVPGIAVSRSDGFAGMTQIRIRGSEANQVMVMIDGIKASDPSSGEFNFGPLLADDAARIEVLRGQQSALYGSEAIGGVVNYISLSGREAPGLSARFEAGSFATVNSGLRYGGVAGNLDYAVTGSYYHTGGAPTARGGTRDVGSDTANASAKLNWSPTDNFKLTAVLRYNHNRTDSNQTNEVYTMDWNTYAVTYVDPNFGLIQDSPGSYNSSEALYGLLRAELTALDGRWTNALSAQFVDMDRRTIDVPDSNSPRAGQDNVFRYGYKGGRYRGSYESSFHLAGDTLDQRLTLALDAEREEYRNISPAAYNFGVFGGKRHKDTVGLVAQYQGVLLERFAFGGSYRYDDNSLFRDAQTWRIYGSAEVGAGLRLRAAAGSGIKDPGFEELFGYYSGQYTGNPNLKPEKSQGWEAGADWNLLGDALTIGATYFENRFSNEIYSTYQFVSGEWVTVPQNRTSARWQQGVEAFARARLGKAWRIDLAYTYLDAPEDRTVLPQAFYVGTPWTGQAVRRPRHSASANLSWTPERLPLSATLSVRYTGKRNDLAFTDTSYIPDLVQLRPFTLVNLSAAYKVDRNITLTARVENLLDERYEQVFSYASWGRAGFVGLRLSY